MRGTCVHVHNIYTCTFVCSHEILCICTFMLQGRHTSGFYLGIFVWGGSSGEGTAQDARLAGGPWVLLQGKF